MGRRIAIILACGLMGSGCFVIDEIDAGSDYMDAHSPPSASSAEKKSGASEDGASSDLAKVGRETLDAVGEWWDEVGKPEPDPDDGIVRCQLRGAIQFTRKSTCRTSGGVPVD